jgi:hypothetical protein
MPDKPYLPPELLPQKPAPPQNSPDDFHIGEEFGTAKKNLPPWKIVTICVAVVLAILGITTYLQRPKSTANGAITDITAVEVTGQDSVLVAITSSFKNNGARGFWIHSMKAEMAGQDGHTYSDEAAPASDFDRYAQAFPPLKEHAKNIFKIGDKIAPGAEGNGTILVSFPVKLDAFNGRKSLTITIWPDDQPLPLVITK